MQNENLNQINFEGGGMQEKRDLNKKHTVNLGGLNAQSKDYISG